MRVTSEIQYLCKMIQASVRLDDIVIKNVNGKSLYVLLHLRNHLDFVSGEFSFENLYYLSEKLKMRWKKSDKDSSYYILHKHLSQKDLTTNLSGARYCKLQKYVSRQILHH